MAFARVRDGEAVLDVGSGTGSLSLAAAAAAASALVTGIDVSTAYVSAARTRARSAARCEVGAKWVHARAWAVLGVVGSR